MNFWFDGTAGNANEPPADQVIGVRATAPRLCSAERAAKPVAIFKYSPNIMAPQ
jgi:hypothetical protein